MRTAITGGIGSGKSTLCSLLRERGIEVFDCDAVARDVIAHDVAVRLALRRLLGAEPTPERLRTRIFEEGGAAGVNALVHPAVARRFIESGLEWMECAILFESGFEQYVDRVVLVEAPVDDRIRRICRRDGIDAEAARLRLAAQLTDDDRRRAAEEAFPKDCIITYRNSELTPPQLPAGILYPSTLRFADIQLLRYRVDGFESLPLRQKTFIFHLTEAALAGHDITFDQCGALNLELRTLLEDVYLGLTPAQRAAADAEIEASFSTADSAAEPLSDAAAFLVYLRRFWFSHGPHHHYGSQKFEPGFSADWLKARLAALPEPRTLSAELEALIFDPAVAPRRTSQRTDRDLLEDSAVNFYGPGVTQQAAAAFYAEHPDAHPLNSRLTVGPDGALREELYSTSGLYAEPLQRITAHLEAAAHFADTPEQAHLIATLVDYLRTAEPRTFDAYSIEWVNEQAAHVDFINGFIEVYADPLGLKGTWEALVNYRDLRATERCTRLAADAQWFEDRSPVDPRFRKPRVQGVSAKAITAALLAGDLYPATAIGINLPNADWIRAEHGSKSVTLTNITAAYHTAARRSGQLEEFADSPETVALVRRYADLTDDLHTDLHECLGHGSGQLLPGVALEDMQSYASTIEEARADLFALYYIADPHIVELGLLPDGEAYKAEYYGYMLGGLLTQLTRIEPGHELQEAHMRNRALIARWTLDHAPEAVSLRREPKATVVVHDYEALRRAFAQLLAEVQRIKSEGDYEAARQLVETYGVSVDPDLHAEVRRRFARLNLAPYKGFINPRYTAVTGPDGQIADVRVDYTETYDEQQLRYSRHGS